MNPIEIVLEWYATAPLAHRVDIAFFVLSLLPDYPHEKAREADCMIENFNEWIIKDSDDKLHSVGKVLIMRSFINYTLLNKRLENKDWEVTQELWRYLEREAEKDGSLDIVELMRKNQRQLPLAKRQWQKTLKKWESLCEGPLSDEDLEKWRNS